MNTSAQLPLIEQNDVDLSEFCRPTVRQITPATATTFSKAYHNLHDEYRASFWLGCYMIDVLIGVVGFTSGQFPNFGKLMSKGLYKNNEVLRLVRFSCHDNAPRNTESICLGQIMRFIRLERKDIKLLVTYATASEGEIGYAYQATNWIYIGCSGVTRSEHRLHRYLMPLEKKTRSKLLELYKSEIAPYPKPEQ